MTHRMMNVALRVCVFIAVAYGSAWGCQSVAAQRLAYIEGRASRDLRCAADEVSVMRISPLIIEAYGCGRRRWYAAYAIETVDD